MISREYGLGVTSLRMKILEKIKEFEIINLDDASKFLKKVKDYLICLKKQNYKASNKEKFEILKFLGTKYYHFNRNEESIQYIGKALRLAVDTDEKAICFLLLGRNFYDQLKYSKALTMFQKALKIARDRQTQIELYQGIGSTQFELRNYIQAIRYAKKLIKEICKLQSTVREEKLMVMMQVAGLTLIKSYWKCGRESQYRECFREFLLKERSSKWAMEQAYMINGHKLYHEKNFEAAKESYQKALSYSESKEDKAYFEGYIKYCDEQKCKQIV